jgi:hypothetical protein
MSLPISISKTAAQLPLIRCWCDAHSHWPGLGHIDGDKIKPPLRQAAAIALVAIGALAAAPWLVKITVGQLIGPNRNGEVARGCAPFAETLVIAPTTTFIEALVGGACLRTHGTSG